MLVHTEHVTKQLIQEMLVIIQVRTVIAQFAFRNS
jgi:hypothetical protein